jgi:MFS family permease
MAQETLPRGDPAEPFFAGPGAAAGWFGIGYGWYTVLITALTTMLVVGSTNYAFALFVRPVSAELDLPRATVNFGLVLFYAGTALFGPFVGRILDRYPIRAVALIGAALFGAGMALIGTTSSVWLIAACIFLPVSIGALGCGGLFGAVVVARWFERHRGRALSISAMGTSFGGLVVFPVVAVLVDRLGWRLALMATGAGVWLLVSALALFLRPLPRPETGGPGRADRPRDPAWPLLAVLRSLEFWIIAFAISLMLAVDGALLVTLTPYVQDRGFTLGQVTALTTTMTASAIAGKIVIAWIADKADLRVLTAITAALGIVQCGVLLLTPSFTLLLVADCLAGMAVGGTYPLFSAIVAERFGTAAYGWVRGLMSPMTSLFGSGAVYFAGAVYDAEHSYRTAFLVFLVCAAAAMVLILTLKKRDPPAGRALPAAAPVAT